MRCVRAVGVKSLVWLVVLGVCACGEPAETKVPGMGMGGGMGSGGAPELSSVSPAMGATIGGANLSISGRNFVVGASVSIAGVAASDVTVWSGTLITATLPAKPGMQGMVPVVVQNPDGQQGSRGDLFAYHVGEFPFANPSFFQAADPSVTRNAVASGVAVGDFNGDHQLDYATAMTGVNSVTVHLSNGLGGFDRSFAFITGNNPAGMAVGDFNGDGKLDLAVTNYGSNDVSILLGDGHGSFASMKFAAGMNPNAAAVGDFNGDSKLDLAVTNGSGGNVSVLLGNGHGGFAAPVNFATGGVPAAIAVGDFNDDRKLDLVTANSQSNNVNVLLGDGKGGFAAAVNFATGTAPVSVAVGDVNGDSKLDLVVANSKSDSVSVLLGDAMGGFAAAVDIAVGSKPTTVALVDYNDDKKLDLAVVDTGSSTAGFLSGDGSGGFSATPFVRCAGILGVGDFNGDKKPDLACATGQEVSFVLNDGMGGLISDYSTALAPGEAVVGADFNLDQKLDLATIDRRNNTVHVVLGNGLGGFSAATSFPVGANPHSLAVGDFNGDKNPDLAVTSNGTVSILLGDGLGSFSVGSSYPAGSYGYVAVSDFNNDHIEDLAVVDSSVGLNVLLGDGMGNFVSAFTAATGLTYYSIAVADFDGDHNQDIVVAGGEITADIYWGNGKAGFTAVSLTRFLTGGPNPIPSVLRVGDFDGDNRPDLVVTTYQAGVTVFFGGDTKDFAHQIHPYDLPNLGLDWSTIGDFNGDRKLDLLFGEYSGQNILQWGNGMGGFSAPASTHFHAGTGQASSSSDVVADFNGDQKADIASIYKGMLYLTLNSAQ